MAHAWFHIQGIPPEGGAAFLPKQEARHALGARRLRPGDSVTLFDGAGTRATALITEHRDQAGNLELSVEKVEVVPLPTPHIELCASLPKGDRLSTMLDMCTQAGMHAFTPLECEWSVVKSSAMRANKMERWERIVLEACKQSGRVWAPTFGRSRDPRSATQSAMAAGRRVLIAQPGAAPLSEALSGWGKGVTMLVGPEGGFSPRELEELNDAGAVGVSLGEAILRVETAAVVGVWGIHAAVNSSP